MLTDASERSGAAPRDTPSDGASQSGVQHWEEIGGAWRDGAKQSLWRRHSDVVNARLVERWVPSDSDRVLKTDLFDEAIGDGLLATLREQARRVVGVDVAASTTSGAVRRHLDLRATVADVRCLPFQDGAFDVVFSNSTLDHFEDAADIDVALRELARVLRPGGRLVLTLDNLANPVIWLRSVLPFELLHWTGLVPYFVGVTLGPAATASHVEASGLSVVERSAVLHCPRVFAVAIAGLLDRVAGDGIRRAYLRVLGAFEILERWPTRYVSGHFVVVVARKPTDAC